MSTRRIRGWHVDSPQQSSTATIVRMDVAFVSRRHLPTEDSERGTTHVDLLVAAEGLLSN
jgi:hypothetical protein